MLMLFNQGLRKIPFERALPYNDDDLLLIVEPKLAFRLSNIISDKGETLSIRYIMEKQEVFACKNFDVRINQFVPILNSRIERYFDTEKSTYIFFDEEEQNTLFNIFNAVSLNCHIDVYIHNGLSFEQVKIEDLSSQVATGVLKRLHEMKARGVIDCREYYNFKVAQDKKAKEAFKRFRKVNKDPMEVYFKRYSKLEQVKSKKQFKKYARALLSKFHPDVNSNANASDNFTMINNDIEVIKNTKWYKKLPE